MSTYRIDGFIGEGNGTAATLAAFLAENTGPVEVIINSPGGDAFEGAAMAAEIERHGAVTAIGEGVVASAATLPFMAAREIVLHRDCMVMIHDPSGFTFGPSAKHRKAADTLDKLSATYADFYARHSGNKVSMVAAWMRDETWLDAQDAVALNFADRIEGGERVVMVAAFDFTQFRNAPAELMRMARQNGWATASPDTGKKETTNA